MILILYTRTSRHVGEYYGPNFSYTESTSYPEKKEKARIKFMNFCQKYVGSVFWVTVYIYIYIYIYIYETLQMWKKNYGYRLSFKSFS